MLWGNQANVDAHQITTSDVLVLDERRLLQYWDPVSHISCGSALMNGYSANVDKDV